MNNSMNFCDMVSEPLGNEWSSIVGYMFAHQPRAMLVILEKCLHGNPMELSAYFLGMAVALNLVEDNGIPIDIDEALHGWTYDEPINLIAAIQNAREELGL